MLDLSPLWISLRIAILATAITFVLGIAAAHFMHRYRGRWRSLLDGIFLAPMVLPPTMLGFLLLLLFGKRGPLGALLDTMGVSLVFTWYAAIVTATVTAFPLMYKTVLGAIAQIDSNLERAARTLGASELRLFWQVTLPLAFPGIVAGTTLAFARALGEFGATLMLAGNIPGKTQTIPMAIYFAVEAGAFGEAAVWAGIILAIALGGLMLANGWPRRHRWLKKRLRGSEKPQLGASRSPRPDLPADALPSAQPVPSLSVTLVKHLPGFTLDISFSSDRHPLGLLGASGAGKSLILRCIAGIETPDSGRIVANGRVLFDSELGIDVPTCDRRVGILFQNYALFPHLTVAQNVAFGLPAHLSPHQRQQVVGTQLAAVQLQEMGDRYPSALSGGQQQRVAMARMLASQPEVLLLDEPFSALDTHLRYLMERDLKLRLASFPGIALFVTHNIEEAYRICTDLLVMDRGRASIHDSKYAVLDRPNTVSAARLTGCKNISRAVPASASTIRALDWNCTLHVTDPIPADLTHIGIRAHQLGFSATLNPSPPAPTEAASLPARASATNISPNTFPCWLATTSETPHRMTLYLKVQTPPTHAQDYHLQAEIFKDRWAALKDKPLPWAIALEPHRLMMLSDR